jgi:hypothetical protein
MQVLSFSGRRRIVPPSVQVWENLDQGCTPSADHLWDVLVFFEEFAEECLRSGIVAAALHQDVQQVPC